ncbi:MAG: siroheme synthase CysG [Pseudomonadota bacterium]
MRHFPIFVDTRDARIVVVGGGACAAAKLRLLMKTEAAIHVFAPAPEALVESWAEAGRLTLYGRLPALGEVQGALLLYAAQDDEWADLETAELGRRAGVKTLVVDNLEASDFITPAIVDRDPVTVAVGTEGAAPVLARKIKAELEEMLPSATGPLARAGQHFRDAAEIIPQGPRRRAFWSEYYFDVGPQAAAQGSIEAALHDLLTRHVNEAEAKGHVTFVGAGPGDPELLTLKARKALHDADVVIHDGLVSPEILELARREAEIISVAKEGFGPAWAQDDINALLARHGAAARVVRLKSGDGGIFGRLDEEIDALAARDIPFAIVPGITSAVAAAASMGVSLTRRGRNSAIQFLTGHDLKGFADHDWARLAEPDAVAAIYMGRHAARFIQGRMMMHGAPGTLPVSIVFNASRADQRIVATTLAELPEHTEAKAPAILFTGLAPRAAAARMLPQPAATKEASHAR